MGDDSSLATGVLDSIIGDTLFGLGMSIEDQLALTRDQRIAEIARAGADGRIGPEPAARLRALGLLPTQ